MTPTQYTEECEQVVGIDVNSKLSCFPIEHDLELVSNINGLLVKTKYIPDSGKTKIQVSSNRTSFCSKIQTRVSVMYLFLAKYVDANFVTAPKLSRPTRIIKDDKVGRKSISLKVSVNVPVEHETLIEALWYAMVCNRDQLSLLQELFRDVIAKANVTDQVRSLYSMWNRLTDSTHSKKETKFIKIAQGVRIKDMILSYKDRTIEILDKIIGTGVTSFRFSKYDANGLRSHLASAGTEQEQLRCLYEFILQSRHDIEHQDDTDRKKRRDQLDSTWAGYWDSIAARIFFWVIRERIIEIINNPPNWDSIT